MDAATPDHYTDTRKLFDYCFENFQALNISENDAGLAKDNGKNYGVLNDVNLMWELSISLCQKEQFAISY